MFADKFYLEAVEISCASVEASLFKKPAYINERKFFISIEPDTRSIPEPRALLQYSLYLVNLLGIAVRCPLAHLLVVEKVTCDVEI